MKLRYLRIGNYPPLNNAQVVFASDSPLGRDCSIRFVVGVNGSGKSHLLQAISEVFLALADWRVPHFPVTLVYELAEKKPFTVGETKIGDKNAVLGGQKQRTIIIAASRTESQVDPSFWVSETHPFEKNASIDDFETLIDSLYTKNNKDYRAVIAPGSWSGVGTAQQMYLPDTVLAYTTGELSPWQTIWARNNNIAGIDSIIEDDEADVGEHERPVGWTIEQELEKNGDPDQLLETRQSSGWKPILITPELLKFALLAVALPYGLEQLKQKTDHDLETGLNELLKRANWQYPVSVSFELNFNPTTWSESSLRRMLPWFEAAGEITGEPVPGTRRYLHFDLLGRLNKISDADTKTKLEAKAYEGEALLSLLNDHSDSSAYERFERLCEMHQEGLFNNLQIVLRKSDTDDLIRYDELSDGEQMVLGRMALFFLLEEQNDVLLLLDEPETHFNDKWKREIVDIIDNAVSQTTSDILISTHSAIVLSDVFNEEIIKVERKGKGSIMKTVADKTFATDPSALMIDVFDADDSVGQSAIEHIEALIKDASGTQKEIKDIELLISRMGPGFYRSELRSLLKRWQQDA